MPFYGNQATIHNDCEVDRNIDLVNIVQDLTNAIHNTY